MALPTMTSATNHEPAHSATATPSATPVASTALGTAGTRCEAGAMSKPTVSHNHTDTSGVVTPKVNATIIPMSAPHSATRSSRLRPFAARRPPYDSMAVRTSAHAVSTSPGMPSVTSAWMRKLWALSADPKPTPTRESVAYQSAPTALSNARMNPSGPQPVSYTHLRAHETDSY